MTLYAKMVMALAALGLSAGMVVAGPQVGERGLSEEEIREITNGNTFHYTLMGKPRGEEQHFTDGRVTWRLPDGLCMHGVWIVKEDILCYFYGLNRYGCWNVIEGTDKTLRHSPVDKFGNPENDSPSVHIIRISKEPVACAPQQLALLSQ